MGYKFNLNCGSGRCAYDNLLYCPEFLVKNKTLFKKAKLKGKLNQI